MTGRGHEDQLGEIEPYQEAENFDGDICSPDRGHGANLSPAEIGEAKNSLAPQS